MNNNEKYKTLIKKIRANQNGNVADLLRKLGISYNLIWGLSTSQLKQMSIPFKNDNSFANFLWEKDIRETKLIALMIFNPNEMTVSEIDNIVNDFSNVEMVEQAVIHFLINIKNPYIKSAEYCQKENEFVKMAGYTLLARLSMKANNIDNDEFVKFFQFITADSFTNSVHVKKAISFALRKVGIINKELNEQSIQLCKKMDKSENQNAKWIANDAMIELEFANEKLNTINK